MNNNNNNNNYDNNNSNNNNNNNKDNNNNSNNNNNNSNNNNNNNNIRQSFLANIVDSFKPLPIFAKKLHHRCSAGSSIHLYCFCF